MSEFWTGDRVDYLGPSPPLNPEIGDIWKNSTNMRVYRFNGLKWIRVDGEKVRKELEGLK